MTSIASDALAEVGSWWSHISPARKSASPLRGTGQCEIVIIGGGFTGLSTALHLAQRGRKVTLLEGRAIGWGGSGRNNGQVIPVLSAVEPDAIERHYGEAGERLVTLVRDSASYLFDLVRRENIACEAEQSGWFQPAHSPAHVHISKKRCEAWAKRGAPCQLLDKTETQQLLGSSQWHGGMLNPTGGHINPLMLARGLAQSCEKAGVTIHENTPVDNIQADGTSWSIHCANAVLTCDAVLLATNAYGNELSTTLEQKVTRSIVPVTSWQMATLPIDPTLRPQILPGRQAVSDTRGDLQFFRLDSRDRLISGGALMIPVNPKTRLRDLIGGRLAKAFPQLGKPVFSHVWSGFIGMTPDHYPHFHKLGGGYWAALGYNGRGVALSISIGRELARAMDGDDLHDLALPLSQPKTIPFHPIARRVARSALAYYRWKDGRSPKP